MRKDKWRKLAEGETTQWTDEFYYPDGPDENKSPSPEKELQKEGPLGNWWTEDMIGRPVRDVVEENFPDAWIRRRVGERPSRRRTEAARLAAAEAVADKEREEAEEAVGISRKEEREALRAMCGRASWRLRAIREAGDDNKEQARKMVEEAAAALHAMAEAADDGEPDGEAVKMKAAAEKARRGGTT